MKVGVRCRVCLDLVVDVMSSGCQVEVEVKTSSGVDVVLTRLCCQTLLCRLLQWSSC